MYQGKSYVEDTELNKQCFSYIGWNLAKASLFILYRQGKVNPERNLSHQD